MSQTLIQNGNIPQTKDEEKFLERAENVENSKEVFKPKIRWPDLIAQLFIHLGWVYGLYLVFYEAKLYTSIFAFCTVYTSGFGITAGVHRLWSHRSYKAKWPLRLLLCVLFTITGQRDIYTWALDHRIHHKFSETDSDPHNVNRGFFFAHIGWLFLTPHPDVVERRKHVDMSDLEADPIVMFQKKYYPIFFFLFVIALPVFIPVYFWNESLWISFFINFNFRFAITLNIAFFVNSVAHLWGAKPYDKTFKSVESLAVSIAALGEGWHNYHHVFPWDYKTGELGNYFNLSTQFIDFFAWLGWAYDRKSVTPTMVERRANRTGDGSRKQFTTPLWGYGDEDLSLEDKQELLQQEKSKQN